MNPTHSTRRLNVTVAALAAAALALPAGQSAATAASYHHTAQATMPQAQNGLTFTDLKDLANVKRDLQAAVQQMQRGMTFQDLQDLATVKRGLFRR